MEKDIDVAMELWAFDELKNAIRAGDDYGVADLKKKGLAITIKKGTKLLFLDVQPYRHGLLYSFRVQDGPHKNKKIWASSVEIPEIDRLLNKK